MPGNLVRIAAGLTVAEQFRAQALSARDQVAIEEGDRNWTYGQLARRVTCLARHLAASGVGRGSRIAVLSENRHEYLEVILAAAQRGATVACLNWRLSKAELSACLQLATPSFVIVSERHAATLAAVWDPGLAPLVFGEAFEAIVAAGDGPAPPCLAEPEDGLTLLYTSGTTGRAKGAVISQRALIARATICVLDNILVPGLAFVAWAPFFHIGANDSSLATLMHGGKVVIIDGFKPEAIAEAIKNNEIGWLSLAGTVGRMVAELRRHAIGAGRVRVVGSMADLVPREDIVSLSTQLRAPFLNSFASTETGLAPASKGVLPVGALPAKFLKKKSSLCSIRLVDSEGHEVAEGEPGALVMRGPSLFTEYFGDEAATKEAFRGGWYHTGDLFVQHPEGLLEFIGRDKYLIKSGGENIYPAEIEQIVLSSPRIEDAVLVGKPDAQWGEVPVLFVVSRDPDLTAQEVCAMYASRIAKYKTPKEIRFVESDFFVRSSTGKVIRSRIPI